MSTIINGIGRVGIRVAPTSGGGGYTTRTTAFAAATGITDTTILNALNTFDLGLISNGLDTKMKAVYPFVGATSTTQKFNFMDARDLDIAFRLTFFGGGTFSSNGYQTNGINAWANTFLIPSSTLSLNSTHASIYCRTNNMDSIFDVWATDYSLILSAYNNNAIYYKVNQGTYSSVATTSSLGMTTINRNSSTIEKAYRNSTLMLSSSKNSNALSNNSIVIAKSEGGGVAWSNRQYSFSSIGDGLTDGEATTFYNLVQAMQTSLSRQV